MEPLENIKSLGSSLKSEMSVGEPSNGRVKAEITIQYTAPSSSDGSEVVFLGVGMTIIDGRERDRTKWVSLVNVSRPSDCVGERQKYDNGEWVGKHGEERFPAYTADEQSHGEILFPGESLVYEFDISESDLPYLELRIEGSVSRRHLFRLSRSMEIMKKWRQPLLIETFQAIDKINYYNPLLSVIDKIPEFGPQTTLADIDAFRSVLANAQVHVDKVMTELNKVYHSAPNQELREHCTIKCACGEHLFGELSYNLSLCRGRT
jgi:hypothetical protein